jgi:hypothetical protein
MINKVFENRVLRQIFGSKREDVVGGWRRLHNEELRNLYASPDVIRVIKAMVLRWSGHTACVTGMRNSYNILVEKCERKRPLGRHRHTRENNI